MSNLYYKNKKLLERFPEYEPIIKNFKHIVKLNQFVNEIIFYNNSLLISANIYSYMDIYKLRFDYLLRLLWDDYKQPFINNKQEVIDLLLERAKDEKTYISNIIFALETYKYIFNKETYDKLEKIYKSRCFAQQLTNPNLFEEEIQ